MNPADIRKDIEQFVTNQFAFLIEEKGFHLAPVERKRGYTTFRYLGERIGFELYVEYGDPIVVEGLINVQATQQSSSSLLKGVNATKLRLKRPFFGALRNTLGVSDNRIEQVSAAQHALQPWNRQLFENVIRLDGELVRDYIDMLSQLPTETLFAP